MMWTNSTLGIQPNPVFTEFMQFSLLYAVPKYIPPSGLVAFQLVIFWNTLFSAHSPAWFFHDAKEKRVDSPKPVQTR